MRLEALEAFSQGFSRSPAVSRTLLSCPLYRARSIWGLYLGPQSQPKAWIRFRAQSSAAYRGSHTSTWDRSRELRAAPYTKQDGAGYFIHGPKRREPEAWVALLDQYLPKYLRKYGHNSGDEPENPDLPSIGGVSSLLDNARHAAKVDLLSYIGIYQERWEAVYWLATAMLATCPPYYKMRHHLEKGPTVSWKSTGLSLDEMTSRYINLESPTGSRSRLDSLLDQDTIGTEKSPATEAHQMLGSLWQGLGSMLLEVEDRSSGNPNRPLIMSHVLQILAQMHHQDVLPDTIYDYDPVENTSILKRPPTLYLLSSTILSDISDLALKNHGAPDMAGYDFEAQKRSLSGLEQLQMPRVGPEVWLELVLWACVDGGWISEAGWLVSEIGRRHDNPERRWSAVSWEEVPSTQVEGLGWMSGLKKEIAKIRLKKVTGTASPNRRTSDNQSATAIRTLSREIILSIADGLANLVADVQISGLSLAKLQACLMSCKGLLDQGQLSMDSGHINALILRAMEASAVDQKLQPGFVQMLLALAASSTAIPTMLPPLSPVFDRSMVDTSAPILGLLHKLLHCYAQQGNLRGSLQALRYLQDGIDSNRDVYIQDFAEEMRRRVHQGAAERQVSLKIQSPQPSSLMLYPEIPTYAVTAFLDLLIEFKAFDLGNWILFNDDIDGGILSRTSFSDASVQPALLRFATATANEDLLMKVLEHLETPLSEPVLHALLRCQVAVNRWDGVEGILRHFRDTNGMAWTSADAMTIAAAIPTLEWEDETKNIEHSLRAKGILEALVRGDFNSPQNRAQVPDLRDVRRANQLARIFRTVSGALSSIQLGPPGYLGRAGYSVVIPSDAFNVLLASVIQSRGSRAGVQLWERWCLEPTQIELWNQAELNPSDNDGSERVVKPTISMLRLILQPTTESLKGTVYSSLTKLTSERPPESASNQDPQPGARMITTERMRATLVISGDSLSVFDWCIEMYRKFGFSEREIRREIPPSFGHIVEI